MKKFAAWVIFVTLILLNACGNVAIITDDIPPEVGTHVAETQTAAMWTPTPTKPSATPVPDFVKIINALNGFIKNHDPLGEAVDARFYITDLGFYETGSPLTKTTLWVIVECEYIQHSSCTTERAFVLVMAAFRNEKTWKAINEFIPSTLINLQVIARNHRQYIGTANLSWNDVVNYVNNKITHEQLGNRISITP
ncbi:MAG: hypothetical protein WBL25_15165 [Anaerolineales bacterium]